MSLAEMTLPEMTLPQMMRSQMTLLPAVPADSVSPPVAISSRAFPEPARFQAVPAGTGKSHRMQVRRGQVRASRRCATGRLLARCPWTGRAIRLAPDRYADGRRRLLSLALPCRGPVRRRAGHTG